MKKIRKTLCVSFVLFFFNFGFLQSASAAFSCDDLLSRRVSKFGHLYLSELLSLRSVGSRRIAESQKVQQLQTILSVLMPIGIMSHRTQASEDFPTGVVESIDHSFIRSGDSFEYSLTISNPMNVRRRPIGGAVSDIVSFDLSSNTSNIVRIDGDLETVRILVQRKSEYLALRRAMIAKSRGRDLPFFSQDYPEYHELILNLEADGDRGYQVVRIRASSGNLLSQIDSWRSQTIELRESVFDYTVSNRE